MSWPAARQSCHRRGGHLAALDTDTEFAMAVRMLTTEWSTQNTAYVWIGLTKKTIDWSSGNISFIKPSVTRLYYFKHDSSTPLYANSCIQKYEFMDKNVRRSG